MNHEALAEKYREFFNESEAGRAFVEELSRLISDNHEKAEDNPEQARDYMQRARGNREVLKHIQSVTTELKKGKASK